METMITIAIEFAMAILWPLFKVYIWLETIIIRAICFHKHIDKYNNLCINCGEQR